MGIGRPAPGLGVFEPIESEAVSGIAAPGELTRRCTQSSRTTHCGDSPARLVHVARQATRGRGDSQCHRGDTRTSESMSTTSGPRGVPKRPFTRTRWSCFATSGPQALRHDVYRSPVDRRVVCAIHECGGRLRGRRYLGSFHRPGAGTERPAAIEFALECFRMGNL